MHFQDDKSRAKIFLLGKSAELDATESANVILKLKTP